MKYNTSYTKLIYPEYGRHVQDMVDKILEIEDRDRRTIAANRIISMMGQVTNATDESQRRKVWDHLHIMSHYKLDVDCPYEIPQEGVTVKREKLQYKKSHSRTKPFGSIVENVLKRLSEVEEEKRPLLINKLANLMKNKYISYNQESVTDEIIINTMKKYCEGLDFDVNKIELISLKDLAKSKKFNKNKTQKK